MRRRSWKILKKRTLPDSRAKYAQRTPILTHKHQDVSTETLEILNVVNLEAVIYNGFKLGWTFSIKKIG